MKNIPEWVPGATFKKKAAYWGKKIQDGWTIPFKRSLELNVGLTYCAYHFQKVELIFRQASGTITPCFTTSWLSKINQVSQEKERERLTDIMQMTAGTAFLAGFETVSFLIVICETHSDLQVQTASSLLNFVLHMVQEPHVQKRAHEELDTVIGRDRFPSFEDKDDLPYINALCKEVLRWHPVLPLGIPHGSVAEDEYKGMRIPKGTAVVPNAWYVNLRRFRTSYDFHDLGLCLVIRSIMGMMLMLSDRSGSSKLSVVILRTLSLDSAGGMIVFRFMCLMCTQAYMT